MSVSEMALDLGNKGARLAENPILYLRRQILVGEIDGSLEMSEYVRQPIAPTTIQTPEFAVELAQRLTALRLGLGRSEVGDRFGLQKIELAVEESAAGELAWFGQP